MKLTDRYKLFIFDFDGTLADTLPVYFDCFETIFTKYGLEASTRGEIESWFGPNEIKLITKRFSDHEQIDQIVQTFLKNYQEKHPQLVTGNFEVLNYLAYLRKKHKQLAIYTGKGRETYEFSTRALKMEQLFDYVVTGDDVQHPKPDPEGLLKVLSELDVSPSESIYLGDSTGDILTAQRAGIACAMVKWFCPDKQYSLEPTYVIEDFSQLYRDYDETISS